MTRSDRGFLALLLLGTLLAYLPGLKAPGVYDDDTGALKYLRPPHSGGTFLKLLKSIPPHRHLSEGSFVLNAAVTGRNPAGLRAGNLCLHAGCTLLVFLIARRLGAGLPPAFPRWAAAFFALHPLAVEAVTYLAQRSTGLEAALAFLSLALYLGCRTSPSRPRYLAALGAALLAMTAKESAVTLPLMLGACEWILRDGTQTLRRILARWLPFAALVLLWPLRLFTEHALTVQGGLALASETAGFTPLQYLLIESRVLAAYLRLNLLPFPLHFPHDPVALVRGGPPDIPAVPTALCGAALLALAAWALFGPVRHRLPRLGAALFLASQALESSVFPLWDVAATHRCYPGLLGTGLLFAWALAHLPQPCARLGALALALLAILTAAENRRWRHAPDLYARDLRHAWHAGVNWGNCAWTSLETGHPEAARRIARQGVRLPYDPRVGSAYVTALLALGRDAEAREEVARVKGIAQPLVWLRLATRETLQAGDPARIEALMREAEGLDLAQPELALRLVQHLAGRGKWEEAETLLRRYLGRFPGHGLLWDHLGYLLFSLERFGEAEDAYRRAARLGPDLHKPWNYLGLLALKRGDPAAAEAAFRQALRIKPDYALARKNLEALRSGSRPFP